MLDINDLKESNEFLNALLDNLIPAVFIVDKDIRIHSFNNSFKALFHKPEDRILGELFGNALGCAFVMDEAKDCGCTSNCDNCLLRNTLIQVFNLKIPAYKKRLTRKFYINDQEIVKYFIYTAKYVYFNNEEMVLIIVDDITELMETNLQLKKMTITDGLTQLHNHNHLHYKLDEEINRAKRYGNKLSIIMLDIDQFKSVNDSHGHQVGDKTLASVGKIIKKSLREIDIPGRYGGEEFLVILPHTGLENSFITAERIRKTIESAAFEEVGLKITVSGGVAEFQMERAHHLIDKADKLLYKAKQKGKNRIEK